MSVNKTVILVTAGILIFVAIFVIAFDKKQKNASISSEASQAQTPGLTIMKTWELPDLLNEISGMAYLGDQKIAAVQDENGQIFIYDLKTSKISKRISFAGSGDYEGIAIKDETAYVLRSDGTLFEVENYMREARVKEYSTPLKAKNDIEGLFYDKENDRLLLAVKTKSFTSDDFKGAYAFDLGAKQFSRDPVYKFNFEGEAMKDVADEDVEDRFFPSEIALRESGEIVLLEAKNPKLLLLSSNGKVKKLYRLDKDHFPQPEGLALDEDGNLYVSNEGNPATIHLIQLK